jgi:X-X-X-Leu-X-X-Gly heptad repeat protein
VGSKAGALLPTHAFLEKIPSQEKRPPGDLPKNLRNARDRNHTSQDETEGRRPLPWSHPASRVSIPARAAKGNLSCRYGKKGTTAGAGRLKAGSPSLESGSTTARMPQPLKKPPRAPLPEPETPLVPLGKNGFFASGS